MDAVIGLLAVLFVVLLVPGGIVGVVVLFLTAERRRRKKKAAALTERTRSLGWSYASSNPSLVRRWRGDPFIGRGAAEHVLYGAYRDRHVLAFEYNHTEVDGAANISAVYYTVVAVTLPAPRPTLEITPTGFAFASEFREAFDVHTENGRFAADVLHPGLTDWLFRDPRAREYPIRFEGTELLSWADGRIDADRALELADYLIDFVERTPAFVLRA